MKELVPLYVLVTGLLVFVLCLMALDRMHPSSTHRKIHCYVIYGVGYVLLGIGALVEVAQVVVEGHVPDITELLFMGAFAVLQVMDRRGRPEHKVPGPANIPRGTGPSSPGSGISV